jgi:hypothetical protein
VGAACCSTEPITRTFAALGFLLFMTTRRGLRWFRAIVESSLYFPAFTLSRKACSALWTGGESNSILVPV